MQIKTPLTVAISDIETPPTMLNSLDWKVLEECVPLLKPVEDMTTELSGEKYPTLSMVIPLLRGLQYTIKKPKPDTVTAMFLQTCLLNAINERFGLTEKAVLPMKACYLDPRFKKTAFALEENAKNAEIAVKNELHDVFSKNIVPCTKTTTSKKTDTGKKSSIWDIFDAKVELIQSHETPTVSSTLLIRQYNELAHVPRTQNPMAFWKAHSSTMPELSKLSKKYLCIPATSVPSERLFSKAGLIANDRRNRLKPKHVDMLVFLNSCL